MIYISSGLLLLSAIITIVNLVYMRNLRPYLVLSRRGMRRVKVKYRSGDKVVSICGWSYQVDLDNLISNPVSQSSSFVKLYVRGYEETVLAFSQVEKLDILKDSYLSVVLSKKCYF